MKYFINADDFGRCHEANMGVVKCFRENRINRATIMVNMPGAEEARRLAIENGFFDKVGLHLNFVEGPALSDGCRKSVLCDENGMLKGRFHIPVKSRLYVSKEIRKAVSAEAQAQIERFFEMGFPLRHVDSHQFVHTYLSVAFTINKQICRYGFNSIRISHNIPTKEINWFFRVYKALYNTLIKTVRYKGKRIYTTRFFGDVAQFEKFQKGRRVTKDVEIMVHPIWDGNNLLDWDRPFPDKEKIKAYGIDFDSE